jgi:hypothetical protein
MPAEMAAQGPSPDETAIFEQMREQISPQEFTNEMLAGAEQVDPQTVAAFRQGLEGLSLPMEILDAINDLMDQVLENPADYQEMRDFYISEGVPEDLLPEQFDPEFFAAFNMAVDQMLAEPTGVQAFAKGGIAELKPIAKAIASYGRDGDTMLAHITPAEARMLRRRGGSGTINPDTGLPEFKKWYKKLGDAITKPFKAVAKAVKDVVSKVAKEVKRFAKSTVGRIVLTVALGFFLGPAAASMLGVTSAAGVAAVGGFIGSAGSTLAAGGNLKDALKAGAVGGLTAGAGAGIMGGADAFASGSYTGATTVGGQFDTFKDAIGMGGAPVVDAPAAVPGLDPSGAAPVPTGDVTAGIGANQMPVPDSDSLGSFIQQNDAARMAANTPASLPGAGPVPTASPAPYTQQMADTVARDPGAVAGGTPAAGSYTDDIKNFYNRNISPSGIQEAGQQDAMGKVLKQFPTATAEQVMNAPASSVLGKAYSAAMPGMLATYGPAVGAGLGIMGLSGGFQAKQPQLSETAQDLLDRDKDRPTIEDRPDQFYIQGLKGVKYDDRGKIIGSQPYTPTATMDDIRVPAKSLLGDPGVGLPPLYSSAPGAMGSAQVAQPYNTSSMYANLMAPPRFAEGGGVNYPMQGLASLAQGGYPRRTGQVSGPGTEKSDSIPAMLSDGEFVMTAKAVRGAGKGSRRAGAKKMYALMHQLERNASRG